MAGSPTSAPCWPAATCCWNRPATRRQRAPSSYITFVADVAVQAELSALAIDIGAAEKIAPGDGAIYWQVPKGNTPDSTGQQAVPVVDHHPQPAHPGQGAALTGGR